MKLTVENAECGMVVKLSHPDPAYSIGKSNPAVGSIYECTGVVANVTSTAIQVRWKNGLQNTYKKNELTSIDTGLYIDIWKEF